MASGWHRLKVRTFPGIYDVVGNLGSLAARLVFSKIEESAYFYFTQTVSRDKSEDNKVPGAFLSANKPMLFKKATFSNYGAV